MTEQPRKRPAFEPVADLFAPAAPDPEMKRPITTVVGALFVFFRAVVGAVWLIEVGVHWDAYLDAAAVGLDMDGVGAEDRAVGFIVFAVAVSAVLLVDVLLGVLILRGRNWPRVLVMTFSVISVSTAFAAWWAQGQEVTLRTSLLTVAFDILLLLALSSRSAAAYARRDRARRLS